MVTHSSDTTLTSGNAIATAIFQRVLSSSKILYPHLLQLTHLNVLYNLQLFNTI